VAVRPGSTRWEEWLVKGLSWLQARRCASPAAGATTADGRLVRAEVRVPSSPGRSPAPRRTGCTHQRPPARRHLPGASHPLAATWTGWTPLAAGVRVAVQSGVQSRGRVSIPEAAGVRCGVHCVDAPDGRCLQGPHGCPHGRATGRAAIRIRPGRSACGSAAPARPHCSRHCPARCPAWAAVSTARSSRVHRGVRTGGVATARGHDAVAHRTAGQSGRPAVRPAPCTGQATWTALGQAADGQSTDRC
jgi:hypothetical protein